MEKYDVLESDCFYHIFNRGNNKEDIFKESDNYYHFFKIVKKTYFTYCRYLCLLFAEKPFSSINQNKVF